MSWRRYLSAAGPTGEGARVLKARLRQLLGLGDREVLP